jgi:hypothetical protein
MDRLNARLKAVLRNKRVKKDYPFIEANYWVYGIIYPRRTKYRYYVGIALNKAKRLKKALGNA